MPGERGGTPVLNRPNTLACREVYRGQPCDDKPKASLSVTED